MEQIKNITDMEAGNVDSINSRFDTTNNNFSDLDTKKAGKSQATATYANNIFTIIPQITPTDDIFSLMFQAPADFVEDNKLQIGVDIYAPYIGSDIATDGFKQNEIVTVNFDKTNKKAFIVGGGVMAIGDIKVKQYTALPSKVENNIIAVITDKSMTYYTIDLRQPAEPNSGDVWAIQHSTDNSLTQGTKDGVLNVRLGAVKQYINASWRLRDAYIGVNGVWIKISNEKAIYGMKIAKNNSDPLTRTKYTDDAAGMTPCYMDYSKGEFNYGSWRDFIDDLATPVMLNYNGAEAYELDRLNQNKKADGTPSDIRNIDFNGNAMVRVKKIYIKVYDDSDYHYIKFSFEQIDDTYKAYAFTNQNTVERDNVYMPMFRGSLDSIGRLRSIAGQTPMGDKTGQEEIDAVNKNGSGYYTQYWSIWNLKAFLLCLIGKTTNTQLTFGQGNVSGNSAPLTTGTLVDRSAFFGYSVTTNQVKCFYSEVMWGDQYDRLMGCIIDTSGNIKIKNYPSYNPTGSGYTAIRTVSENESGYLKYADITNNGCIGTDLNGSDSTYFSDYQYLYKSSSEPYYAMVGGYWGNDSSCGAFILYCSISFSHSISSCGASPFFIAP